MELKRRCDNLRYIINFYGERTKKLIIYNMIYGIIAGLLPVVSLYITKSIMNIIINKINNKLDILAFLTIILILINIVLKFFSYINSLVENINSLVFLEQFEISIFRKINNIKIKCYAEPEFNDLCQKIYLGGNTNCTIVISEFFLIMQLIISIFIYIYSLAGTNISFLEKCLFLASAIIALIYRRYFFNRQERLTIDSKERIIPLRRKLNIFKRIFFSPVVQDELRTYNAQEFFINTINLNYSCYSRYTFK